MAKTYTSLLATSTKDWIRFRLSDSVPGEMILSDEEITGMVTLTGDRWPALRELARGLIVRFGKQVTQANLGDGVGFTWGERVSVWRDIVSEVDLRLGEGMVAVVSPAIYRHDPYSEVLDEVRTLP